MAARKSSEKKLIRSLDATGFYSDFEKENTLYAALIRSPAPAGKVKSITVSDLPEGYSFFTADDIPAKKFLKINKTNIKIFGHDSISYTGEPLGILVGPDEDALYKLLENVSVNLDVEDLEDALHNVMKQQQKDADKTNDFDEFVDQINDMPSLDTVIDKSHIEENPNVTIETREIKYGLYETKTIEEVDKELFEKADFTFSDTWTQDVDSPEWQETEGAFCYMEGANLHVYAPSRWVTFTQKAISEALDIKLENIFIHKTKISSLYPTGLWRTTQLAIQTALAAYLTKKPVKLVLSQAEQTAFMDPGLKTEITYNTAANKDGKILALKINIDIDVGTTNPFAQEITDRITLAACNYYQPENLYIHTNTHTSKNPPSSISIKIVDSQAFFAIENEIEKIATKTENLPYDVRVLNSSLGKDNKLSAFPFDIQVNNTSEVLKTAISSSDFNRKYASFQMEAIDRIEKDSKPFFALPLRGIGVGTGFVASGYNGSVSFTNDLKIEVTLTTDNKLIIHTIKPSEVIQDIWKTSASEILQIPKQNIVIDSEFRLEELPESPEDTNSSLGIMNDVIRKCCMEIQKKRFHQPLPISSKKAVQKSSRGKWDKENFCGSPFVNTSFIATVVEVELDTYTYSEKIKGIWIAIDCGELFDEAAAQKSIKLEIQQELATLVKGKMVTCDQIKIQFIKSSHKSGQIGGLVHNSLPAAFSSALSLALTTQLTALPCTEVQLFELIKNRVRKVQKQGE